MILTYLFTHPTIDVDNRMLLPLFVGCVMSFYAAWAVWQAAWFKGRLRLLQVLPWLIAILCVAWYIPQTRDEANFYHAGDGLTAYHWNRSEHHPGRAGPAGQSSRSFPMTGNCCSYGPARPIYGFWNTFPAKPPIQATAYGSAPATRSRPFSAIKGAALVIVNDFRGQFQTQIGKAYDDQILFTGLPVYGTYADGNIYLCHK